MLHNLKIDWNDKHMNFAHCEKRQKQYPDTPCHILRTSTPMPDWEALYPKAFSEESYKELPQSRPGANCVIKFKKDPGYLQSKIYPLSAKERVALHQWITEDVKSGRLIPCESDYVSTVFFRDEGDKLRPIVNYKQLHSHCIKDIYPLPRINETVSRLKKAKIYSKYDVMWRYKRILMDPKSQHYAAIICEFRVYKPTVMLFGLQNAPELHIKKTNSHWKSLCLHR